MVARASSEVSEPMLMILPAPRGTMRRAASRPQMKAAVRLVSMTRHQSSVPSSSIGLRNWMPALLIRMSTWMPSASKPSKAPTTAASSVTSKAAVRTSWPASRISAAATASRSAFTPFRMTRAPAAARPSAKARPSPREEPVIIAVLPVRSKRLVLMARLLSINFIAL